MNEQYIDSVVVSSFLEHVWGYYAKHGRHDLPWRLPEPDGTFDPYKILVSELMLQQTQVARVIPKYEAFLRRFPTVETLAEATLGDVLKQWQGLGYNRRAKFLWQTAQALRDRGRFPTTTAELVNLPGIGVNTAGAIQAYAFNQPVLFVETNIRTVFIHHFFPDQENVSDKAILKLLAHTLSHSQKKEWSAEKSHLFTGAGGKTGGLSHNRDYYWALMDYGSWLKTTVRTNAQSKHYTRQSKFEGSKRQVRGQVIRELTARTMSWSELSTSIQDERLGEVLGELTNEGLIVKKGTEYSLC